MGKECYICRSSLTSLHQNAMQLLEGVQLDQYNSNIITSGPLASLLLHYDVVHGKYKDALDLLVSCSKNGAHIDEFSCNLLAFHLYSLKKFDLVYSIMVTLQRYHYGFTLSSQLIDMWIASLIKKDDSKLLGRFCNQFIGKTLQIQPSYCVLEELAKMMLRSQQFAIFGNIMRFTVDRMNTDGIISTRIRTFRDEMTLNRFSGYISKLGAKEVIANGMFHTFGFAKGKHHCKVTDFPNLINGLSKDYPKIDYQASIRLIQMMHGFHIKEYPGRYSPLLHPDRQIKNIYKTAVIFDPGNKRLKKGYQEASMTLQQNPARNVGKPKQTSNKFRNKSSPAKDAAFEILPLNIVLKLISITNNDLKTSLTLVRSMIKNHQCPVNNETFLYLTRIFSKNAKAASSFSYFFQAFKGNICLNEQLSLAILDLYIKADSPDSLYEALKVHSKLGFIISNDLFNRAKDIFERHDDKRYGEFVPTLNLI